MAVLMTDSRKLPRGGFAASSRGTLPYWVSSVYINLLYALRHHYDFLRVELPERGLLRHSSWYKLQVIRVLLSRYEYVMYLDSDAFFLSQDRTIGSLVAEFDLQGSKHLLLPENGLCCETANTGVMLWRNSPEAMEILEDWWWVPSLPAARFAQISSAWLLQSETKSPLQSAAATSAGLNISGALLIASGVSWNRICVANTYSCCCRLCPRHHPESLTSKAPGKREQVRSRSLFLTSPPPGCWH